MTERIEFPTPDCPHCGHPPMPLSLGLYDQRFCENEECNVLCWNPRETAAENAAGAQGVELSDPSAVDPDAPA